MAAFVLTRTILRVAYGDRVIDSVSIAVVVALNDEHASVHRPVCVGGSCGQIPSYRMRLNSTWQARSQPQ